MKGIGCHMVVALAAMAAGSPALGAQQRPASAVLLVTIGDAASRDFLSDVEIRIRGTSLAARTDGLGEARVAAIEPGTHEIDARRLGYLPRSVGFSARAGDTLRLLLLLDRAPRPLDTIRITAAAKKAMLLGFEERRQSAHGYFLDESQLDSTTWLNNLPAALAMRLPWLAVGEDSHGLPYLRTTHKGSCGPVLFLDGHEVTERTDLGAVMARELAGVEFYDDGSRAPTTFQRPRIGVRLCSVILLWSR